MTPRIATCAVALITGAALLSGCTDDSTDIYDPIPSASAKVSTKPSAVPSASRVPSSAPSASNSASESPEPSADPKPSKPAPTDRGARRCIQLMSTVKDGENPLNGLTAEQLTAVRADFAASSFADLRETGTEAVDTYLVELEDDSQTPDDLTESGAALARACENRT